MSWKTICQMDLHGKRVLTRVDLNVPMVDGKIADATRIEKIIPTVNEITKKGGTPILLAHMGRPKGKRHQNLAFHSFKKIWKLILSPKLFLLQIVLDLAQKLPFKL